MQSGSRREPLRRGPIEVRPSTIAGWGVFARRPILEGALVEECAVLVLDDVPEALADHVIEWQRGSGLRALPLGYGALYNHADSPNAGWSTDVDRGLMVIGALRDIAEDEEILISYGPRWFGDREVTVRTGGDE